MSPANVASGGNGGAGGPGQVLLYY
jgi:hypothetical protein